MKKLLTMLGFLLITYSTYCQNLKALDTKNGFRDMKFGSNIAEYKDLVPIEEGSHAYERTSDALKIGEYEVKSIVYDFYKGQLSTIMILTEGYTNSKGVLAAFEAQYGKGYKSNRYLDDCNWFGKEVRLSYHENSATHDASIFMFSNSIYELEKKDKAIAAEKAKSDL